MDWLKEAKASKGYNLYYIWLVLKADNDTHVIAGDVNFNDDGSLGDVGNVTTMPTVNVLKLKVTLWNTFLI